MLFKKTFRYAAVLSALFAGTLFPMASQAEPEYEKEQVEAYHFDNDHKASSGRSGQWKKDEQGNWKYTDGLGWYAKNRIYTIDGTEYAFDQNGYLK